MKERKTIVLGLAIGIGIAALFILALFVGIYLRNKKTSFFPFWERRYGYEGHIRHKFGHGIVGNIESIDSIKFTVKNRFGEQKNILVDDKTIIKYEGLAIKFSDLKKDDRVVVIGEPSDGGIKARMVRLISDFVKDATGSVNRRF